MFMSLEQFFKQLFFEQLTLREPVALYLSIGAIFAVHKLLFMQTSGLIRWNTSVVVLPSFRHSDNDSI